MAKRTEARRDPTFCGLTPQLRGLAMQHEEWWDRWASEQDGRDKPTEPVFHYTNWDGFSGIMQSESFWLHSIYCMNDKTELDYGLGIARQLLIEKNVAGHLAGDELVTTFLAPQLDPQRALHIRGRFDFYSVSFGVHDDAGQWEKYGDNRRGVAIGLEPHLFANITKPNPAPEDKVFVAKVRYGSTECTARHQAAIEITFNILEQARQLGAVQTNADGLAFVKTIATLMNLPLVWNSITTKSEDWQREQELRMLATNDLTKPHLTIHHRHDGRSYVVIPMPMRTNGSISEIMVGCDADTGAEDDVRMFLHGLGMTELPKISRAAPVR
jgi:Protein of unknown function (DUF2971)